MSKTAKISLSVVGLLVLFGGLIAGVFLVRRQQEIREKAAPATSLSISPPTQSKNPGQTLNFSVRMDTGENQVTGLDIRLSFDPSAIEIVSIQQGSGILNLNQQFISNSDNTAGQIAYSTYTAEKTKAVQGTGLEVLNISASVKTDALAGSYTLSFLPSTAVAGLSEGQNVLTGTTPAIISVLAALGGTPTPTPTPAPTPTPTPPGVGGGGATPTPTPTPTASPVGGEATPTPVPLPETGASLPTIFLLGLSVLLVIGAVVLAI